MTDRATCWSITINNPTEEDLNPVFPAGGWTLKGQPEVGANGTRHLQAILYTPQVRVAAVKKVFPRAHIEVARNRKALEKYVQKEDTRAGDAIVRQSDIPTIFEYQTIIASQWEDDEYSARWQLACENASPTNMPCPDEVAMQYLDSLVAADIEYGRRGAEYIAINPMWRSSWKRFWRSIIKRHASQQAFPPAQADEAPPPAPCDA